MILVNCYIITNKKLKVTMCYLQLFYLPSKQGGMLFV